MAPEDTTDPKELERQRFLEEIRRRAEEAEMRRIEEEEESGATPSVNPEGIIEPPRVESGPAREPQPGLSAEDEELLIDLRSRFALSVHQKDLHEATAVYDELADLIPGTRELSSFERQLRSLRRELSRRMPEPEPPVASRRKAEEKDEEKDGKAREARRKKIAALLGQSLSLYQQEKYEKARVAVNEILELDPENDDARELMGNITKAKELADLVKAEEDRLRAEEAAARSQVEAPPPEPVQKGDVWGESSEVQARDEHGISVDEEKTAEIPKEPILRRFVAKAKDVRVPIRPLITGLVILTAMFLGYFIVENIQVGGDTATESLVILPGWHAPSDTLGEILAVSLAGEITGRLGTLPGMRVIAASSAAAMTYPRPAAAARALGVKYYVHWNIRTTPASVSFEFTLRDTSSGEAVWTMRKESSLRELPTAVQEIASDLAAQLFPDADPPVLKGGIGVVSTNEDAYIDYLRGRFLLVHAPGRTAAKEAFRRALEEDQSLIPARTALAWTLLATEQPVDRTSIKEASVLLNDAGTIESQSVEGLRSMGMLEQLNGGYDRAQEYYGRAVMLAQGDAESHRRMAVLMLMRGRPDEALESAVRASSLDPLNVSSHITEAMVREYRGEYRPALSALRRGLPLAADKEAYVVKYFPELLVSLQQHDTAEVILNNEVARNRESAEAYYRLGRCYQAAGKPIALWGEALERAREILQQRLSSRSADPVLHTELALVYTRLGRQKEASIEIERALKLSDANPAMLYNIARAYSIRKEFDQASSYLEKAIDREYDMTLVLDMDFFNVRQSGMLLNVVTR